MNQEDRLCSLILLEHFGTIVRDVCMYLYNFPRITLREISRGSGYPIKKTKDCLFILMQSRIVYYCTLEDARGQRVLYKVIPSNIIIRQYFHNFGSIIAEEYGPACKTLYLEVAKYGRISPAFLVKKANDGNLCIDPNLLASALESLINEKFIVPVKATDMLIPEDLIQKHYDKEITQISNLPLSTQSSRKLRQRIADMYSNTNEPPEQLKRRVADITEFIPCKVKPAMESSSDPSLILEDTSFYCINYDRVFISLRNNFIMEVAEMRMHKPCLEILKGFFMASAGTMNTVKGKGVTCDVHINELRRALASLKVEMCYSGSEDPLLYYLDFMNRVESHSIKLHRSVTSPQSYYLNIDEASTQIKVILIESIAHHSFGADARRVWRILYEKGCMNELQVANVALIPVKIARMCLFHMLYSGLIFIHSIPKSMDFSTSKTLFLWGVNIGKTSSIITNNAYRMLCDIKEYRRKQMEAHQRLFEKLNRTDVISGDAQLSEKELQLSKKIRTFMCDLVISEEKISKILMTAAVF